MTPTRVSCGPCLSPTIRVEIDHTWLICPTCGRSYAR